MFSSIDRIGLHSRLHLGLLSKGPAGDSQWVIRTVEQVTGLTRNLALSVISHLVIDCIQLMTGADAGSMAGPEPAPCMDANTEDSRLIAASSHHEPHFKLHNSSDCMRMHMHAYQCGSC